MDGARPPISDHADDTADDARYLQAVAACGDKRRLVVSQPIYSAHGIKLLDVGARIDSRVLDRLFGHTLAEPIDRCVASEDAIRHRDLVEAAREFVAATPLLVHFEASLGPKAARCWSSLQSCPLPPAIALRLTVVRDTAPVLYRHSLAATFIALFIGVAARFTDRDLHVLATAGLLHDIGMMYADPAQYEGEKPLDVGARRNLYAHPLTGQLIAQREPLLNAAIATAIAQHHERADGTGYPRGLAGEAIGKLGRVLALTEVISAVLEHEREQPDLRLSLILRLNHRSFDTALSQVVLAALPNLAITHEATPCSTAEAQLVDSLFVTWRKAREAELSKESAAARAYIDARVERLRRWLSEAGFWEEGAVPEPDQLKETPLVCAEMNALAREALWHLRQIAYEALHRWPDLATQQGATHDASRWLASALSIDRN